MKKVNVTRRDAVAWSAMTLWIVTALIVYLFAGKDWIFAVDMFYCIVFALLAKYRPKCIIRWMENKS